MRILITGSNGQLGTELRRILAQGWSALGEVPPLFLGAEVRGVDLPEWDLSRQEDALLLARDFAPDVIFHCAAFTAVDRCETDPDAAFRGNALAARNIAIAAESIGAKLVHVSTDYVFDGHADAPIEEWALPGPQSVYGHTKRLGEQYVQAFCSRWFILRTAWLYGRTGGNFVRTMLRLGREKDEITVVDDQIGNPTNAEDLAHHALRIAATGEYGLYHVTGKGICSWYEFAGEIMRLAGLPCAVKPVTTAAYLAGKTGIAPRPAYSALAHRMLEHTVGDAMRPWQEALADYLQGNEESES